MLARSVFHAQAECYGIKCSSKIIIADPSALKWYDFPISISVFAQLKRPSSETVLPTTQSDPRLGHFKTD